MTFGTNRPVVVSYFIVTIGLLVLSVNVTLPTTVLVLSKYGVATVWLHTFARGCHDTTWLGVVMPTIR